MFLLPDFLHLVSFGSGTGRTQLSSPLCLTFCLATPLFTSIAMMADVPMTISIVSSLLLLCTELHPRLALPEGQRCSSSWFPGKQHWLRPASSEERRVWKLLYIHLCSPGLHLLPLTLPPRELPLMKTLQSGQQNYLLKNA